jgi:glycerol-3-phosphate O-acyltransferase
MFGTKLAPYFDPNSVLQAGLSRFFERIQIDETWLDLVREAARKGPVVYVLRNLSFLDFLALDYITKRFGLPQVGFANDFGLWVLEPFASTWTQALMPSKRDSSDKRLAEVLTNGGSAALFLKRPPTLLEKATRRQVRLVSSDGDTLVRSLFDIQRKIDRPIQLVPQVFVWSKRPASVGPSLTNFVFGASEWPGRLRLASQFLLNYDNVLLRAGEPFDLFEFLRSRRGESEDTLVRQSTYALLRKVERERRAVLGPMRKPADRVRDEIIRTPKLQAAIAHLAGDGRAERMLLTARAYRMLRDMEAAPDPEAVFAMSTAIDGVLSLIYAGLELDKDGIARIREAAKKGTIVLLPSHKSHMDYLLLSYVLKQQNLPLPLIAAGDNLSFFPIGMLLRRGGAFFIRRSFKGDRLYVSVVDAYLRRLLRDGWPIEFFLEGTRSRTGKLLPPKLGLLNMIVESALSLRGREVFFIPISIGYERLLEERAHVRELLGAEKAKENATGLLRALKIFAEQYGRLNIQVGEIFSLSEVAAASGATKDKDPTPAIRREITKHVGYRTMAEINNATAATPGAVVALALLTHGRRGMPHAELVTRVRWVVAALRQRGARMTEALATPSGALRPSCVREATNMFEDAELVQVHVAGESLSVGRKKEARSYGTDDVIYSVPDHKRLALDLSKNIILHFFVPEGLLSTALLAPPGPPLSAVTAKDRAHKLAQLFKYEFMFHPNGSFDQVFQKTLSHMLEQCEVQMDGEQLCFGVGHDGVDGRGWLVLYASMLRNFFEAYRVAARGLATLLKGPLLEKDLTRRTLTVGDQMYLAGEIERHEALSRQCLENAFQSFVDQGYLRRVEGKKFALAESFQDVETVRTIESRILNFLPRRAEDRA